MTCGKTFEFASGEMPSPCSLPKGHEGSCKGVWLGTVVRWDGAYSSEYEIWCEEQGYLNGPNTVS